MKVIGSGSPERLTVRFAPSEHALILDELDHQRSVIVEHLAVLHERPEAASEGGSTVEQSHAQLTALHHVLEQVESHRAPTDAFAVSGPTWFLAEVIRGTSQVAAENLLEAVTSFLAADDEACSDQQLRDAAGAAQATTATLIAVDMVVRTR